MDLFEKFDEVLNSDVIESFEKINKNHSGDFSKAFKGIFYTMVAGLIRRSNSPMSTNMLMSQIKKNYSPEVISYDFGKSGLKEADLDSMIKVGQNSISQIFPAFKSPLLSLITSYAGTGKQETTDFTGYITAYFIKKLGEMITDEKVSSDDLIYYLQQHRETLFEKVPRDLVEKMIPALGLQEISTMKVAAPKKKVKKQNEVSLDESGEEIQESDEKIEYVSEYETNGGNGKNKWWFLLFGLIALGLIAFVVYENKDVLFNQSEDEQVAQAVEEEIADVDSTTVVAAPVENFDSQWQTLKTNLLDKSKDMSIVHDLPFFNFEADSVEMDIVSDSKVKELIELMRTNAGLQIQILGNHGAQKDNIALKRAFALKKKLLDGGVENIRIDAAANDQNSNYLQIRVINR